MEAEIQDGSLRRRRTDKKAKRGKKNIPGSNTIWMCFRHCSGLWALRSWAKAAFLCFSCSCSCFCDPCSLLFCRAAWQALSKSWWFCLVLVWRGKDFRHIWRVPSCILLSGMQTGNWGKDCGLASHEDSSWSLSESSQGLGATFSWRSEPAGSGCCQQAGTNSSSLTQGLFCPVDSWPLFVWILVNEGAVVEGPATSNFLWSLSAKGTSISSSSSSLSLLSCSLTSVEGAILTELHGP